MIKRMLLIKLLNKNIWEILLNMLMKRLLFVVVLLFKINGWGRVGVGNLLLCKLVKV